MPNQVTIDGDPPPSRVPPGGRAMLEWVTRNRVVVLVAALSAFALDLLIMYGFGRWWPGCEAFNTDLQQSVTLDRARAVTDRCPQVSAGDVQEVMVVDTIFPVLYVVFLGGILLLFASLPVMPRWASTAGVWFAWAAIVGGVLDMTLENGSLVLVTVEGWPPGPVGATEALLLVAGIAAWVKWALLYLSLIVLGCLLVTVIVCCARTPRSTT